ncbi:hypothetical protein M011DRAFT_238162 [Sporormia fimetaria CBS 119925]|uniref:Uncharacterized protein n=1 Tax=Sporormia fimetaria CBS 119925 TaxID=1340428 RepID=A0A6A6VKJ5_9PLEO|nr:hypothetical protein M011DRAFT_238162 [Sporormia fimetaria CBS 119925]
MDTTFRYFATFLGTSHPVYVASQSPRVPKYCSPRHVTGLSHRQAEYSVHCYHVRTLATQDFVSWDCLCFANHAPWPQFLPRVSSTADLDCMSRRETPASVRRPSKPATSHFKGISLRGPPMHQRAPAARPATLQTCMLHSSTNITARFLRPGWRCRQPAKITMPALVSVLRTEASPSHNLTKLAALPSSSPPVENAINSGLYPQNQL